MIRRHNDDSKFPKDPILQVLQIKELNGMPNAAQRYRVVLSDGMHFMQCMFIASLSGLFRDDAPEKLQRGSLFKAKSFTVNDVRNRKILVVLDGEIVPGVGPLERIGQPTLYEVQAPSDGKSGNANGNTDGNVTANTNSYVKPQTQNLHQSQNTTNSSNRAITMIEAISPYQNRWTIKARVTRKTDIKHWHNQRGEGKLFSVNLMDESGEIRATAFNNEVDQLNQIFQEGSVYYISKCRVNIAKKEFTNISHEYELHFDRESIVEKCEDQHAVPQIRFDFKKIGSLDQVDKDAIVDTLGVLKEVGELSEITSKATNKAVSKRDLIVVDDSSYQIRLTIWGKTAENFSYPEGSILAFKGAKVSDFNGRSLSMFSTSTISQNPDIPEAHYLRGWYEQYGKTQTLKTHQSLVSPTASRSDDLKTLCEAEGENLGMADSPDYYNCKATIIFIKKDNIFYPACPTEGCNKKVIEDTEGQWRCERCDKSFPEPNYRYIMTLNVHDHTGQQWFNAFDDVGHIITGRTANELFGIKQNSEDSFNDVLHQSICRSYIFRVRAKQDQYGGTTRVRHNVMSVTPIDFAREGKHLVAMIERYSL